jgi:hypothetical protein
MEGIIPLNRMQQERPPPALKAPSRLQLVKRETELGVILAGSLGAPVFGNFNH